MSSPILIIGAGLGGLSLAQSLHQANIPVQLFERDHSANYRAQGYRLGINSDGLDALESSLPPALFTLFTKTCAPAKLGGTNIDALTGELTRRAGPGGFGRLNHGENASAGGPHGTSPPQGGPPGAGRPPVFMGSGNRLPLKADRTVMREVLMTGLHDRIHFGKEFTHYTLTDGGVTAHFHDGSSATGSLLVGADGLRSRVRKQLIPTHQVLDAGARVVYGKTLLTPDVLAAVDPNALENMTVIREVRGDDSIILFLEPMRFPKDRSEADIRAFPTFPKDYIYWVLGGNTATVGVPDETLLKLHGADAAKLTVDMTKAWTPGLRAILELQDPSQAAALRVSMTNPDMEVWETSAHVTVLGDAVHVMPPTGGVGANSALKDAATLGQIIREAWNQGVTVGDVRRYEDSMREYAKVMLAGSWSGRQNLLGPKALADCERLEL